MKAYILYVERSETQHDGKRSTKMFVVKIFSLDKARRRRQYRVYGKPPQRRIAEKDYHEAFLTPGISPLYASSLKQIRQTP